MNKQILYVGSRDNELVSLVQTLLKERSDIILTVLDRADLNTMDDRVKQKLIDWKEKESISNYIREPHNVKLAIAKGEKLFGLIKEMKAIERFTEIMEAQKGKELADMSDLQVEAIKKESAEGWDGWFTLKDAVEATTLSYSHARELIDMLFTFGFLAFREVEKVKYHTILLNEEMQSKYLTLLIDEKKGDIKTLEAALKAVKSKGKEPAPKKLTKKPAKEETI